MALTSLLFGTQHATIAGLLIDASVQEDHDRDAEVTEYPVEDVITTDHVQVKTPELKMEGVITDAPIGYVLLGNIINLERSISSFFGSSRRSIDGYNTLVDLMTKRVPFDVVTTLAKYSNMVIKRLSIVRTSSTGNAIHFIATMKQIRIVQSQVGANVSVAPSVSNRTAPTTNAGNVTVGSWTGIPQGGIGSKTPPPPEQIDATAKEVSTWSNFLSGQF